MTALTDPQRRFLDGAHHAIVATLRRDGTPSQSIVWYIREGDTLWISVRPDSVKARHIRRDPRIAVLIPSADGSSYLRLEGTATLDGEVTPSARRALVSRYVGMDQIETWLAAHPLPSPNARLRIQPQRIVAYGSDEQSE